MIDLLRFIDGGRVGGVALPPLRLPGRDPIRLSEKQRTILAEATAEGDDGLPRYRTVGLCWPKGGGKSLIAAAELARCFVTVPDSRSIILGPSERQVSSVVAHMFRDLLRATYPGFEVLKTVIENPALGSSVVIVPASEASVQGVRPHRGRVVIDEAHEFPADPAARADSEVGGALNLLLSQAEDPSSQVWLLGMLGTKDGYLHWLRDLAADGAVPHCSFSYETDPLALNPTMTQEFLAQRKAEMLPALYRVHFENEAAESAAGVFSEELLAAARARGREFGLSNPVTAEQWRELKGRFGPFVLAAGLDRAMAVTARHDRTVFATVGRPMYAVKVGTAPVVLLNLTVFPQGHSGGDILAEMRACRDRYGRPRWTVLDSYQTMDLAEAARKVSGPVELLHETTPKQTVAFTALSQHLRDGRLVLGEGEPTEYLCRELARLHAVLTPTLDSARFEGKPHDDSAHATALACLGLGKAGREYAGTLYERRAEEDAYVAEHGQLPPTLPGLVRQALNPSPRRDRRRDDYRIL